MNQSHNSILNFQVNLRTELPYSLFFVPSVYFIGLLTKEVSVSSWPFALGLTLVLSAFSLFIYRLNIIHIDTVKQEITLTETNLVKRQKSKTWSLNGLQFTYRVGRTSPRSRSLNILTFFINDKEVGKVIPDNHGWTDHTVNELALGLVNLGVPKKFTGYSFKDAEIKGL